GWMRFLIGFGQHAQVVAGVEFPLMRETLFGPGFEDDLEMLMEALTAFCIGDGVAFIGPGKTAPPDPKVEASLTDLVYSGSLLGEADRVAKREHTHRHANAQAGGTGGNGTGQDQRHRNNGRNAGALGV